MFVTRFSITDKLANTSTHLPILFFFLISIYRLWSESWQVLANESGSMTREFFVQFVDYFCERMDNAGYGRVNGPGRNVDLLLDGHTSRWTFAGLLKLIKRDYFPFCIPSHTSMI